MNYIKQTKITKKLITFTNTSFYKVKLKER